MPPAAVEAMRARARQQTVPDLNPASPTPLKMVMNELSPIDALSFIAASAGINIVYEPTYKQHAQNKPITLNVSDLSLQEALNLVMTMSQSWFKVINSRTIFVMPDTPQMRQKYEEQVVRTFYLSHADATEVNQIVSQVGRLQTAGAAQIVSLPNKTANTLTVRASAAIVNIIEKVILANDRPRAEVVVDVEILEVSRDRAKSSGSISATIRSAPSSRPRGVPAAPRGDGGDEMMAARRRRRGNGRQQSVQPADDLARHQHGGFLHDRAVRGLPLPGHRLAHAPAREAAAARRGRRGTDAGNR